MARAQSVGVCACEGVAGCVGEKMDKSLCMGEVWKSANVGMEWYGVSACYR